MAYQEFISLAFNPPHKEVLLIDIAELPIRSTQRRQEILQLGHLLIDLEKLVILERRRHSIAGHVCLPRNSILPRRQILVLPDPPDTVDVRVVQPERGVTRAGEEVSPGVATNCEVAPAVHPEHALGKDTLHVILEVGDVIVRGQQRDGRVSACGYSGVLGDVTAQTARVVAESIWGGICCYTVQGAGHGSERNDHVFEGA